MNKLSCCEESAKDLFLSHPTLKIFPSFPHFLIFWSITLLFHYSAYLFLSMHRYLFLFINISAFSINLSTGCSLNIVFFPRMHESLPPLPHQHSAAIGCTKNYQPIGVAVHSPCVESFEGLLQRSRRGRGCSEF